jgi:hypothetical protein
MQMAMPRTNSAHLIETDAFPFEFISHLAERESWRKEVHRPIYHVHKWWAKRLGSVFRGILLGSMLPETADLATSFYKTFAYRCTTVFDPFMGSGTTITLLLTRRMATLQVPRQPAGTATIAFQSWTPSPRPRHDRRSGFSVSSYSPAMVPRSIYRRLPRTRRRTRSAAHSYTMTPGVRPFRSRHSPCKTAITRGKR